MKTLNWYVTRGFLITFFMAIGILTFAMTGANLIKVLKYMSQGVSFWTFCQFTFHILPIMLTFTIPWAVMVAVMLVFGRLSADSEITAMRACGVSILQVVSPIMLLTIGLTVLCLYLQVEIGPPLLGKSRNLMDIAMDNQPMALLEPGKQTQIKDNLFYIDDKEGDDGIKGIQIYVLSSDDKKKTRTNTVKQDISAVSGKVINDKVSRNLVIQLFDCLVEDKDGRQGEGVKRMYTKQLEFKFPYGKVANAQKLYVKAKYMRLAELMGSIRLAKQLNLDAEKITELEVELNERIAFALAPIAFLLLGLPLAIRTNRRETSVGLFLSVILAGLFFLAIILCDQLTKFPSIKPQYLLWLPNIIYQIVGAVMTYRISQK